MWSIQGVGRFLDGIRTMQLHHGRSFQLEMIFPQTIQTPDLNAMNVIDRIAESNARKWWFAVDQEM